jgi:hypothetical protein
MIGKPYFLDAVQKTITCSRFAFTIEKYLQDLELIVSGFL